MREEDGTVRDDGVLCSAGPEIGAVLPLLEVAVVIVDEVDCFRALVGPTDPFEAGSCSLSNLPIAGFCTTLKSSFSHIPASRRITVPDGVRSPCPSRP